MCTHNSGKVDNNHMKDSHPPAAVSEDNYNITDARRWEVETSVGIISQHPVPEVRSRAISLPTLNDGTCGNDGGSDAGES
mmetsp:Transcript_27959/g.41604  ORF Transcript_27959/g.41604 Transcript_27959/m.41604 type:complete len:80 (-) Transcript_27959:335-574(-)